MCQRDIGEPKTSIEEIVSLATFRDLSTLKMSFREGVADRRSRRLAVGNRPVERQRKEMVQEKILGEGGLHCLAYLC